MAVKKTTENQNPNVSEPDTTPTTPPIAPPDGKPSGEMNSPIGSCFAYVGMSVGRLQNNAVIQGTHKQITEHYKDEIALCSDIAHLIVPVAKLSATRTKIKTSGNALNEYYSRVAAVVNKKRGEKHGN
ncbi:MAG: hypothetical protein FWF94_08775 [Oscillospiraceae bacterium]|nr:hypothetical protein [Oscillospiraceae bacterium]